VLAIEKYDIVARVVAPKKEALAKAENMYQTATKALEKKRLVLSHLLI